MDAAHGVPDSSLVTTMARNGTEFGIRVSGLGDRWFTGPSQMPRGLYFAGHSADDASPDMGDSAITETAGLGGFAMAAAPAIVQFVGGVPPDAIEHSRRMYEITIGESEAYTLPILNFRGTPTGVDAAWSCRRAFCRRSTRASPRSGRASARSAPAWSIHRWSAFPAPCARWPRGKRSGLDQASVAGMRLALGDAEGANAP